MPTPPLLPQSDAVDRNRDDDMTPFQRRVIGWYTVIIIVLAVALVALLSRGCWQP